MKQRIQNRSTIAGSQRRGVVGGAGHGRVVAQVGVVVVARPVVRGQPIASTTIIAHVGEGVRLAPEVKQTRSESCVKKWSKCLLLPCKSYYILVENK